MFSAAIKSGAAAAAAPSSVDPQFNYVTMLLHGDGTNGAQNNTFLDSSTNNFTITRNGNTTQGSFSPYGDSWSNYFDGTGDYLSTPTNTAFNLGTSDCTIEAWVNLSTLTPGGGGNSDSSTIISCYPSTSTITGYALAINSSGYIKFYSWLSGVQQTLTSTNNPLSVGNWYHIAIVRASGTFTIYVNGVVVTFTGTISQALNSSSTVKIGAMLYDTYYNYTTGYISNVRIVKGTAVYTSSFTPPTTPLTAIANTSLLTCQSNRFIDNSPNAFAITKNGDTSVQRFSPFGPVTVAPYYSGYFDGTGDYLTAPSSSQFAFGTGDFTVECWVYMTASTAATRGIWQNGAADSCNIQRNTSGNLQAWDGADRVSTTAVPSDAWTHIAFARSEGTARIFVNGVLALSWTSSVNYSSSSTWVIGYTASGTNMLTGYASNFRIVKGTALYTSSFTPPTEPLTAISGTSLLTCQSSTFIDNSTNNFTISVFGNSTPRAVAPFTPTATTGVSYSPEVFGGSGYFDGAGDWLSFSTATQWSFGTEDFTVEMWVYFTSATRTSVLVGNGGYNSTASNVAGWSLGFNTSGAYFGFNTGTTSNWFINNSTSLVNSTFPSGTWINVVATRQSGSLKCFVNGTQLGSTITATGDCSTSSYTPKIGTDVSTNSGYYFNGYISNVRLTKGGALYTAAFTPPIVPLTTTVSSGTVSLLTSMTNAGIYDNSMMNDLETVGNAQISTSVKKYGTGSMAFDGNGDYLNTAIGNLNCNLSTGDFTVECWVNLNSVSGTQVIVSRCAYNITTGANLQYAIYASGSSLIVRPYKSTTDYAITVGTVTAGTWYHVALVRQGDVFSGFLNGVKAATTKTISGALNNDVAWYGLLLGNFQTTGTNQYLYGYIDDLRITKGYARYSADFTPPTQAFPNTGPN